MIIREIQTEPELIENFDFFNDFKDTEKFLICEIKFGDPAQVSKNQDILEKLQQADRDYWRERNKKFLK